jgi:hypothetical protein
MTRHPDYDGKKHTIGFDKPGEKRVVDSLVDRV